MRSVAILYVILVGWPGCRLCNRGCGHAGGLRLGVWGVKGTAQVITELIILYFKEKQNHGEANASSSPWLSLSFAADTYVHIIRKHIRELDHVTN